MTEKAEQLRDALLDVLLDAVENGPVVTLEDGSAARVTPDSKILTVALGAVKALAPAPQSGDPAGVKADRVNNFLKRYAPEARPS